ERRAEERHADVFFRRELMADRCRRQGGGAMLIGGIGFGHGDRALEIRIRRQEIGDGAADGRAPGDHDIELRLRHPAALPRPCPALFWKQSRPISLGIFPRSKNFPIGNTRDILAWGTPDAASPAVPGHRPRRAARSARPARSPIMDTQDLLRSFGLDAGTLQAGGLQVRSPIDGALLASLRPHDADDARRMIARAHEAFLAWRQVPAPRRGELVRLLGEELRAHKQSLGRLVSLEAGKISAEGEGEVQEMIDICDFAVGLSRQLHGLTIASERPGHRMMETWHPLGVVGVISAFNFPVAVWSWNATLALVCGDPVVWKPSEKTPLTALACQALFRRALDRFGDAPD